MAYVDGFVAPVPDANREAFVAEARMLAAYFLDCGALEVVDAWGDEVPEGVLTSFPRAVAREPGESVAFGWVLWPSKEARDAGWKKAESDPRFAGMAPTTYDGKRMIFGGFSVVSQSRGAGA